MDQLVSPKIFRSCILFEFYRGKPVFETYKNFCEVMGYEAIKYKEFEVWYHRFSRGEFDLDYDIGSITSDLEFSNLPNDIIEKVFEKCDLKEQLTLRKVSKDLRSLVDKQKIAYKSIAIVSNANRSRWSRNWYIFCAYNGKKVVYAGENWDKKEAEEEEDRFEWEKSCIRGEDYDILRSEDYEKVALNDLSIALKDPKLRLDDLELTIGYFSNDGMGYRLESLLKHLNHQIHVETLILHAESPKYLLSILPCLKPKVLVNIEVLGNADIEGWTSEKGAEIVRKISSLEQWKQAEQLTTQDCFKYFPSECLMHFKRFVISTWILKKKFLKNLRDIFSKLTNFVQCVIISSQYDLRKASRYLESFCEEKESEDPNILRYDYNIPNSDKYLVFKIVFVRKELIITKESYV